MVPTRWQPGLIGAATFLVVLAVAFLPGAVAFLPGEAAQRRSGVATVPNRMPSYSLLAADVSDSPPGRAVALFQQGFGVELLDRPRAVVVGADQDVYRRVDEAEDRGGPGTQGDPAGGAPTAGRHSRSATGQDRPVPDPVPLDVIGENRVLGWTAPDEVAVLTGNRLADAGVHPDTYWLTAVSVDGDDSRRLSAIPGVRDYGVSRFQLASALLPDLRVRIASDVDRGSPPDPLRGMVALLTGMAVATTARLALRRRRSSAPRRS